MMSVATSFGLLQAVVLAIWTVPDGLKWLAFEISRASVPHGPMSMSWAKYVLCLVNLKVLWMRTDEDNSEICGVDAEARSIALGLMNAFGYAFNAWLPYLTYFVTDAPRFRKGYILSTCAFIAHFAITGLVW